MPSSVCAARRQVEQPRHLPRAHAHGSPAERQLDRRREDGARLQRLSAAISAGHLRRSTATGSGVSARSKPARAARTMPAEASWSSSRPAWPGTTSGSSPFRTSAASRAGSSTSAAIWFEPLGESRRRRPRPTGSTSAPRRAEPERSRPRSGQRPVAALRASSAAGGPVRACLDVEGRSGNVALAGREGDRDGRVAPRRPLRARLGLLRGEAADVDAGD